MNEQTTPETDAELNLYFRHGEAHQISVAWIEFARKLEQERDEARQKCADLVQKLDAWQEIAEHLHHLVQHPAYGVDQAIQRMDVLEAYKHLKNEH